MKKITDYLQELGLTEIEAVVYQGLLEISPTTVKNLADHIGIKRITTHFNVENLIERGLVAQTIQGARRQITAEPPERLQYLIQKKFEAIKNLQDNFPDFLNTARTTYSTTYEAKKVEIKYYEGKQGVMSIYQDTLKANEVYSFVNIDRYYETFPETEKIFVKALDKNPKRHVWDIAVYSNLAEKVAKGHQRYHTKFISNNAVFSGFDILIYSNKVAINQLNKNNATGLLIFSKTLFLSLKALHQTMWTLLPNP